MSNINTFRDIEDQRRLVNNNRNMNNMNNNNMNNNSSDSNARAQDIIQILTHARQQSEGHNPRDETFWQMLKINCCPAFKTISFTTTFFFINLILFIVSLSLHGLDPRGFLQPNSNSLIILGAKVPYLMRYDFQIQRFVMPMFLHANFLHILSNSFTLFIVGSLMEAALTPYKYLFTYILTGIGGNLFSALISDDFGVGASTALFGLLGAQISLIILNWNYYVRMGPDYLCIILLIVLMIFINLIMSFTEPEIDKFGHLGGFLSGLIIIPFLIESQEDAIRYRDKINYKRVIFAIINIFMYFGGLAIFYSFRKPQIYQGITVIIKTPK